MKSEFSKKWDAEDEAMSRGSGYVYRMPKKDWKKFAVWIALGLVVGYLLSYLFRGC